MYRQADAPTECAEVLEFVHTSMPCIADWQSKTASCKGQKVCLSMAVEGKVEQKIEIFIVVCDLQTHKYCQYLSLIFLV